MRRRRSEAVEATLHPRGASEAEVAFLRERRVELNALFSDQLIGWLEDKLGAGGIRKVIPPNGVLATAWRHATATCRFEDAAASARKIERNAPFQQVPEDLRQRVEHLLQRQRDLPWTEAVRRAAAEARE